MYISTDINTPMRNFADVSDYRDELMQMSENCGISDATVYTLETL
jgi:hypothetical protein